MEACASSHYWSRELQALGHTVRLMPPAYVKPYVKRQKNDMADAEAICEAVTRANMRFVPTKAPEQQSCLMLHRTRHLFIRQQTALINVIRAHLAEFGIVAPVGRKGVTELLRVVADPSDKRVPEVQGDADHHLHDQTDPGQKFGGRRFQTGQIGGKAGGIVDMAPTDGDKNPRQCDPPINSQTSVALAATPSSAENVE